MTYLVLEIVWYLVGAAVVGAIVGWAWQSFQSRADEKALELNWRKRYEGEKLSLKGVETELEAASIRISDLRADHRHAMAKVDNLTAAIEDREEHIAELTGELSEARDKSDALAAALEEQTGKTDAALADVGNLREANERLESEIAARGNRVAELEAGQTETVARLAAMDEAAARQQAHQTTLEAQLTERDRELAAAAETAERAASDRDAARNEALELDTSLADARRDLEAAKSRESESMSERTRLRAQIEDLKTRLQTQREELAGELEAHRQADQTRQHEHRRAVEALSARLDEATAELETRSRTAGGREAALGQELKRARLRGRDLDARVVELEAALADQRERHAAAIGRVQAELADAHERVDTLTARLGEPAPLPAAPVLHRAVPPPSAGGDDLTQISGIGKVLQRKLNDLGLTRFLDVAQLADETRREAIGRHLGSLRGRIVRDDWVGQARRLHEAAHGSDHDPAAETAVPATTNDLFPASPD